MPPADAHQFRFDCGATWLNLLATKGRSFSPEPIERLDTLDRLGQWLECTELTPVRGLSSGDLALVLTMRETLRAVALATVDQRPPPAAAVAELGAFLAADPDRVRLTAGGRLFRRAPETVTDALVRIVRQAVDQMTGVERAALKSCPEHDCRGIFIDPVGRRRWCPSQACASRGRVRAMRARQATAESS